MYKPYYFPRMYYLVLAQFFIMVVSFFLELTVEDPYSRKNVYIEGVTFISLSMLYFLLLFLVVYYFSYGWLYRSYFVDKIAVDLRKRKKEALDIEEIEEAVGREIDAGLRDEIDERMEYVDGREYDEIDENKPFKLSKISAEDIFLRISVIFDK